METTIVRALRGLQQFSHQHRVGFAVAAILSMAGFAVTAVAVAPLVPDPARLPQRLIVEDIVPSGMEVQLAALAAQDLSLTRSDITRSTDTADLLLARLGVRDPAAAAFMRSDSIARGVLSGRGGKMVRAETDESGILQSLVARFPAERAELAKTHFTRLSVARTAGTLTSQAETVAYTTQSRLASGTISSSLFAATDEAGLPDGVSLQLADIFSTDIDFHRELRKGDTFSVVYETLVADGEAVAWNDGAGRVLAAEFVNAGTSHHAVWFEAANGRGAYYDVDGRSKKSAFLASPMAFSRVTSGFAMRFHPLLRNWRAHLGVDYGAPMGTAVRSVGDGIVEFAGRQNGYGNVVQIRHSNNRSTLYAHLSHIDVRKGQRVEQSQNIGAVGMTGWATGPHLHFEFRVGGQHQDPLRIAKTAESTPIAAAERPRFVAAVQAVRAELEVAETLVGHNARAE